jgi:flagellar motor switch protein FliM
MSNTLDRAEIDLLFKGSQAANKSAAGKRAKKIVPFDLRLASRLTADQVAAVSRLHEAFARRLSASLGAHLRTAFDMHLVSAEQLTYREFITRMPELTYFASLHVMPIDARAGIQCDLPLAYPMVDVVLGGSGTDTIELRDLTEIEEHILETVVRIIVHDLRNTWAAVLELDFQFESRQGGAQVQNMMVSEDKILCLSFAARLAETSGTIAMVFPAVVANALLRRLSAQGNYSVRLPSRESRRRVRERLLDSRFTADLSLPSSPHTIRQLISLEPGKVLMVPNRTNEPIHLNIAGQPVFLAYPVRKGTRRGARIEKRISLAAHPANKCD